METIAILESERRNIEQTKFWGLFLGRIMKSRDNDIKELCASAKGDRVPELQGRIAAYNLILGLPDKIVKGDAGTTSNEAPAKS